MFHVLPEYPVPFRVIPFSSAAMMSILTLSTRRYLWSLFCQAWLIHAIECVRTCCKSLKSKIYASGDVDEFTQGGLAGPDCRVPPTRSSLAACGAPAPTSPPRCLGRQRLPACSAGIGERSLTV